MNTIVIGGLLHDIGRLKSSSVNHWLEGAKWLREQGFYEGYANIAFRHTRHWDENPGHQPRTLEKLIVCWADKAVKGIYLAKVQEALIHVLNVKGIKVVKQELDDIFLKVIYELEKNEEKRRFQHL
ncbi:MAG: HD domain-containing protein [Candidatus Odinarchaeota archaeon]